MDTMKKTFNINNIENLVADQENVMGLLDLLSDVLTKIKRPVAEYDYDHISDIPHDAILGTVLELLRNDYALSSILRFLQDMNVKTSKTISNEVECYYHDARNQ